MSTSFSDYLNSFTESTLSIIHSRDKIQNALDGTTAQAPTDSRVDNPAPAAGVPVWAWVLGAVVVYKLATR
jgi:hypothetical protein